MHLSAKILYYIAVVLAIPGCSNFSMPKMPTFDRSLIKLPEVYKFDMQQGNVIDQAMIDQLKPGMTKSQVRFIMGTPLVADTFNQDRWDYFYSLKPAKGPEVREKMAIFFKGDKLIGLRGDFMPNSEQAEDTETPGSISDSATP
jgi:outer membrane protein assembly factor BamE|tara:strand:+ start:76 stop:507 length:432 start_codon:yes stop_codon:yes gene_type:complete